MKRNYLFATALAVALGVSVAAQSQSGQTQSGQTGQTGTQSQGTQTQGTPTQGTHSTQGTQGTTGTGTIGSQIQQPVPGTQGKTPGSAPGSQPITLTGCLTPAAAGQGVTANGGYTLNGVTGASNGATSYTLLGGDQSAMAKYGSSRVEVIGTTDPVTGAANPSAVGTSGRSTPPASGAVNANAAGSASNAGGAATGAGSAGAAGGGAAGGAGTGASAAAAGGTGAGSAAVPPPNFHVTSIRQVPGSCGGGL